MWEPMKRLHSPETAQSPLRPTMPSKTRTKWLALLLAMLPVSALAASGLRAWITRHTLVSVFFVLCYEIVLLLASLTGRVVIKLEDMWATKIADQINQNLTQRFSRYRKRYLQYLCELHYNDDLTGIPIRAPFSLPLAQVYVDLSLVNQPIHRLSSDLMWAQNGTPVECEPPLSFGSRRKTIWHYIPDRKRIILAIVGGPGSGKTTLLRHVTVTLAESRTIVNRKVTRTKQIPVLLYLREQATCVTENQGVTLPHLISQSLSHFMRAPSSNWFETHLKAGDCLVMLDGLDEVALRKDRQNLTRWIERQIASYPRCSFIITSRPHGYQETPLNAATVLQVRALSQSQIERFVNQWSLAAARKDRNERLSEVIRRQAQQKATDLLNRFQDNDAIQDLAANPLLLTMITHLHNYHDSLPGSRVQLYREICQVLLGRRQEAKGLGAGLLTADQKELILRHLALAMMKARKHDISQGDAILLIAEPLARVKPNLSVEAYLNDIQQSSGILVEREHGVLAFVHETLQEYLAATRLSEQRDMEILKENVNDVWWRETTLLYCAQSNSGAVVRACLISNTALALALAAECVEIALELDPIVRNAVDVALSGHQTSKVPNGQRVITAAFMTRKLRKVIRLDHGTHLVNGPVTWSEYLSFISDQRRQGKDNLETEWRRLLALSNTADTAVGIDGIEAAEFANWVTDLVSDGWSYRLPRPSELPIGAVRRVLNLREHGYWMVDDSGKSGERATLNYEAKEILVNGRVACESFIERFNWPAIHSVLRELNTSSIGLLSRWKGLGADGAEDRNSPTGELLRLLMFISCLDKATLYTTLYYFRFRYLEYSELKTVLTLAAHLDQSDVYKLTNRQLLDLHVPRASQVTIQGEGALAGCLAFQLRLDLGLVGRDVLIGPFVRSCVPVTGSSWMPSARNADRFGLVGATRVMHSHVDIKRMVDLAEHGRLLLHRDTAREGLSRLSEPGICEFTALADMVANQIKYDLQSGRHRSPYVKADLRLKVAACSEFAAYSGRDLKGGRQGGAWAGRFSEIYSAILAGLLALEWHAGGYIAPIESILLVRE